MIFIKLYFLKNHLVRSSYCSKLNSASSESCEVVYYRVVVLSPNLNLDKHEGEKGTTEQK